MQLVLRFKLIVRTPSPRLWALAILSIALSSCEPSGIFAINRDYPLPNGYEYIVPNSGNHMLVRNGGGHALLGYYLKRAYVDDRYVVGEVLERPSAEESNNAEQRSSFFIFDTASGQFIPDLNEADFKSKLRDIGIWQDVELVGRDSRHWLQPQERP